MSVHVVKELLQSIPEVKDFIKEASLEEGFSTANRDSTILSALEINYLTKVAGESVPYSDVVRVNKAVCLYGVGAEVDRLSETLAAANLTKQASTIDYSAEVKMAEEVLESMTSGNVDIEKVASKAEELYDGYGDHVTSDIVKRYAGAGMLNKEAAEAALTFRYSRTKNEEFMKIAKIIHCTDVSKLTVENNRAIAQAVSQLEKEACYRGASFYEEAFMTKQADITIDIDGTPVSYSRIQALIPEISDILGSDIAEALSNGGQEEMRAILHSLPLDLKRVIVKYA